MVLLGFAIVLGMGLILGFMLGIYILCWVISQNNERGEGARSEIREYIDGIERQFKR